MLRRPSEDSQLLSRPDKVGERLHAHRFSHCHDAPQVRTGNVNWKVASLVEETKCLILILDLRMPGIDGLELQRNLTSANKRIPIIFISARATEHERTEAIAGGAVDFLRKPFCEQALFNAIQAALNR